MAQVLVVSKPLAPPWNDGSKNLARDLVAHLSRYEPVGLSDAPDRLRLSNGRLEAVYAGPGAFAPSRLDQARVLRRLLLGRGDALWHFFFAPNPASSRAARTAARLRGKPTVHTVCSRPRREHALADVLFADRTVVLSRHTHDELAARGAQGLCRIAPAVPPLEPLDAAARSGARARFALPPDEPAVLYPGDLEHGGGAQRCIEALAASRVRPWLVIASRPKTPRAARAEADLRARAARLGVAARTRFVGQTPHIHALVGCADIVALPSDDLYAKIDLPLVLIEALWLGRAVLVARGAPAEELAEAGAALAVEPRPEAIAAELDRLLDDESARAELGRRAIGEAQEKYHPARMAREHELLYDALLGSR